MPQRKNEAHWIGSRQRWQIKVQNDGKRPTFTSSTPGIKGKVEAEQKADKWLKDHTKNSNIRFPKLWEAYLEEAKRLAGTSNYKQHEYIGRIYLLPTIKHKKVMDITNQDWQDCINVAYDKGLSKKTCKVIRGAITVFYKYAKKQRIYMERPEDLVIPKNAPSKEKRILQPDDLKKVFKVDYIINHGKKENAFFIYAWRFILITGLRRGELCGLQKSDIKENTLHIRRSINRFNEETPGKNNNACRYMVLPAHAIRILECQSDLLKKHGLISPYIFPDECGECLDPNHLYKKWTTFSKQHGLNCSLHEMRHTFVSITKADISEELLKPFIGHAENMDTTGIYGHTVNGELERTATAIDDVFNKLLK